MAYILSALDVAAFQRDGYVIIPQFFSAKEIAKLYQVAIGDSVVKENALDLNDQTGKKTKLALW